MKGLIGAKSFGPKISKCIYMCEKFFNQYNRSPFSKCICDLFIKGIDLFIKAISFNLGVESALTAESMRMKKEIRV